MASYVLSKYYISTFPQPSWHAMTFLTNQSLSTLSQSNSSHFTFENSSRNSRKVSEDGWTEHLVKDLITAAHVKWERKTQNWSKKLLINWYLKHIVSSYKYFSSIIKNIFFSHALYSHRKGNQTMVDTLINY